ncbi:macrolide export ATP-binding/permease protein MacB [bacterium BMS3Abin04]|nr:macrolide export ATP-binding/permease protein MacB [bacterium BMS3Abin04]
MQIMESIYLAIDSIKSNKLRSALTLLGVGIGLFSIIIVMTAIGAIEKSVVDAFNSIGSNNFIIQKMPAIRMGGHGAWRKYRNRKDITIEQGQKLKEMTELPVAIGISLNKSSRTVKYSNLSTNPDVTLSGMNLDDFIINDLDISAGRGFSQQDMLYSRYVCILGSDVAKKLFKSIDPIGQKVRVNNLNLEVIGVFKERGSVLGRGQDNFVAIPLSTYKRVYGDRSSANLTVMASSEGMLQATKDEVIGALRTIRKVPPGEDNDFEIITNDQLIAQFNDLTKYFKLGAGIIAFIALLAAGVGIMNIMLVSVTERTKEIGIRKAIGARRINIKMQFVVEAVILSLIGGLIGIILGVIGGNIVAIYLKVSVILPIGWILLGLFITTLVGIIFGVYPAAKASNLDPIEALRYE